MFRQLVAFTVDLRTPVHYVCLSEELLSTKEFIKKALIIRRKAAGSSWKTQSCLTVELLSLPVALQYQHCHSLSSWPVRSSRLKNVCEWKNVALTRNQQMIWEACQLRISVYNVFKGNGFSSFALHTEQAITSFKSTLEVYTVVTKAWA